jgi:hypothetical protein
MNLRQGDGNRSVGNPKEIGMTSRTTTLTTSADSTLLRRPLHRLFAALGFVTALCVLSSTAAAQSHWVFVNGKRLADAEVAALARMNCRQVPNGAYWLNFGNGAWGYAGNPTVQGVIGDGCSGTGGTGGQVAGDGSYGPYATMRRANEVANDFRRRGLSAIAFHNGNGYYVRVSR